MVKNVTTQTQIYKKFRANILKRKAVLWHGDALEFVNKLPQDFKFNLVVTSPPYNIGKKYEKKLDLEKYLLWQKEIIYSILPHIAENGSVCWQVGNFIENGSIWPLDIELAPIFRDEGFQLRNRIVWHFGHGLHAQKRFSGRYEVILWFTKTDNFIFNLDPVRVPSKYPAKKHFKGPKIGQYSSNPKGKNPEDVWEIPNVKGNHPEKTIHPCQFPVGLIERLVLSLTNENGLVFDPFSGVSSSGVAALLHKRRFIGCEISQEYIEISKKRLDDTLYGTVKHRPYDQPLYDHTKSKLSIKPKPDLVSSELC